MKQSTKTIIKVTAGVLAALFVVLAVILVASYQSNGQRNSTVDFELNHNEGMVVSYASQNSMRLQISRQWLYPFPTRLPSPKPFYFLYPYSCTPFYFILSQKKCGFNTAF